MEPTKFAEMIRPIITSPDISGYVIGLTKKNSTRRFSYRRENWDYFYIIETDLTQKQALYLEQQYFEYLTTQDKRSLLYKKYHPEKRESSYKPSIGGLKITGSDTREYSIYVACYHK